MAGFATQPDGVKVLSVSELTQGVRALREEGFPSVWVTGEISNLARPSSGHVYFSLKDTQAQLRAVLWRGVALRLRFELKDGQEVNARGRLTVYPLRGEYQLVVEEVQPKGIGAQELALRQLKEKLFVLGYFDPKRKKPLPRFPRRVALVTSPSGAAVRDMLEILARRWPAAEVWVCPVRVQGDGAAQEIAAAVRLLNGLRPTADVLIVGRGGGSTEDLWAFNEEIVAHALFESRIPVVSAVGHEIDLTIADHVADRRALTPSEAAELVVPNREELWEAVAALQTRLRELVLGRLQAARQRWQDLAQRRAFRLPLERVRDLERRLDDWAARLQRGGRERLLKARQATEALAARLETLSPLNVLARGYSLTRTEAGQLLQEANQVRPGDRLLTQLRHGRVVSRVEETFPPAASASPGVMEGPNHGASTHD
jgi:exodeoxyribonuclease VII large subunit